MKKKYLMVAALAVLLGLGAGLGSGCATLNSEAGRDALYSVITVSMTTKVLKDHPEYAPALRALSTGIDVVLNRGTVTIEEVARFVDALGREHGLTPEAKLLIAVAIDELIRTYQAETGDTGLTLTNPRARAVLTAFKGGIDRGIAYTALLSPADAPR